MDEKQETRTLKPDADKIRQLRQAKGWSAAELSKKAKCSAKTIESIEGGERAYPFTLKKIATALGVEVKDLLPEPLTSTEPKRPEIKITLSIPWEAFDESKTLQLLVGLLQRALGGGDINPTDTTDGSTIVTLELDEAALRRLVEIMPNLQEELVTSLPRERHAHIRGLLTYYAEHPEAIPADQPDIMDRLTQFDDFMTECLSLVGSITEVAVPANEVTGAEIRHRVQSSAS